MPKLDRWYGSTWGLTCQESAWGAKVIRRQKAPATGRIEGRNNGRGLPRQHHLKQRPGAIFQEEQQHLAGRVVRTTRHGGSTRTTAKAAAPQVRCRPPRFDDPAERRFQRYKTEFLRTRAEEQLESARERVKAGVRRC